MWRQQRQLHDGIDQGQNIPNVSPSGAIGNNSGSSFRDLRMQHAQRSSASTPPPPAPGGGGQRDSAPLISSHAWAPYHAAPRHRAMPFDTLASLYTHHDPQAWTTLTGHHSRVPSAVASMNTSATSMTLPHHQDQHRGATTVGSIVVQATPANTSNPAIRMHSYNAAASSSVAQQHSAQQHEAQQHSAQQHEAQQHSAQQHEAQNSHAHLRPVAPSKAHSTPAAFTPSSSSSAQTTHSTTQQHRVPPSRHHHPTEDLVHSRSFAGSSSNMQHQHVEDGRHYNNAAPPSLSHSTSISLDIESLQARMVSLSSVNVQLQQDLDAARHEAKRSLVDNSRLRDQLQISSAQEVFLKAELEKVIARQQQLLSFERTPEGLGKVELLEQQNRELKEFVAKKEEELRTMQTRLHDSHLITQRLNAALVTAAQQQRDLVNNNKRAELPSPPQDGLYNVQELIRKHLPLLRHAERDAKFSLKSLMALRHVMTTPHLHDGPHGRSQQTSCALTQRHCAMQCLSLASRGHQDHHDADEHEYVNGSVEGVAVIDALLHDLYEVVAQQQRIVVTGATEFLAKAAEEEAIALLDAAPVPEHHHPSPQRNAHDDETFLVGTHEQLHSHHHNEDVGSHHKQPNVSVRKTNAPLHLSQAPLITAQHPRSQLAEAKQIKKIIGSHQRVPLAAHSVPQSETSDLPGEFSIPPAYPPTKSNELGSEQHHRDLDRPSLLSRGASSPEAKAASAVETAVYNIPTPRTNSAERPADVRGSSNVIRVERSALRRSPIHRSTEGSPVQSEDEHQFTAPFVAHSQQNQQQRSQHRPSIQPPRRGPAGGSGPVASKPSSASGEHYGGCDQQ